MSTNRLRRLSISRTALLAAATLLMFVAITAALSAPVPGAGKSAPARQRVRAADPIAHIAGAWIPDDPGRAHAAGGWQRLQWNFLPGAGVDAPSAWANLIAENRPGAKGVIVAVLDTGVAYRRWRNFKESPDFRGIHFIAPCDLVAGKLVDGRCTDPYPLDREGHGTFVAGIVAEATNNNLGLTGLAYGTSIMPVRVLDANGNGDAGTIANGIRYAVDHGANVINLSLEFSVGVHAGQIPGLLSALRYAHRRGVVVVAAAGNDSSEQLAYPARAPAVISVGSSTADRCVADYSNAGPGLDLVAPGGGDDATVPTDPDCRPQQSLPDLYQMTFNDPAHPDRFSLPGGWYGTSMSAAEVAAGAAMVIASGVLGPKPTPDQVLTQLEHTAQPLGSPTPNNMFGFGLIDLGAATTPPAPPTGQTTTTPGP
jgi:serine protease